MVALLEQDTQVTYLYPAVSIHTRMCVLATMDNLAMV